MFGPLIAAFLLFWYGTRPLSSPNSGGSNPLPTPRPGGNPAPTPAPTPTPPPASSGNYTSADQAIALIKAGRIGEMKQKKISAYYTWGQVFVERSDSVIKSVATRTPQKMRTASNWAINTLDRITARAGVRPPVSSWIRPDDTPNHSEGYATDFVGNHADHIKMLRAAEDLGLLGRIGSGISPPGQPIRFHLDGRSGRRWSYIGGVQNNRLWRWVNNQRSEVTA